MIASEFEKIVLSDGQILECLVREGRAVLLFRDWREKHWNIVFGEVDAVEMYCFYQEDLSHVTFERDNDFVGRAKRSTSDDDPELTCISFISAWTATPVFRILASNCTINEAINPTSRT